MKVLLLSVLLFSTVIGPVFAQDSDWQRVTVGDSTTVDFPSEPKKIIHKGQNAYGLYEEGVLYSVAVQEKAKDAGLTLEEKRSFYDEAIQGAAEAAKAPRILAKTRFVLNGFEGVEATFTSAIAKMKNPVVMRMILVNTTFYGQTFSASASPAHTAARQRFFASFTTRLHPAVVTSAETRTSAYKIGQLMGSVFFYGLLIAGVIFLLKRSTSKKKQAY
jgi:hypothetical protein